MSCVLWQDTSRNLTKVDRMLGQYREHTDDQAEAMALVRRFDGYIIIYLHMKHANDLSYFVLPAQGKPGGLHQSAAHTKIKQNQWCS